jgi:hypothetical protein
VARPAKHNTERLVRSHPSAGVVPAVVMAMAVAVIVVPVVADMAVVVVVMVVVVVPGVVPMVTVIVVPVMAGVVVGTVRQVTLRAVATGRALSEFGTGHACLGNTGATGAMPTSSKTFPPTSAGTAPRPPTRTWRGCATSTTTVRHEVAPDE